MNRAVLRAALAFALSIALAFGGYRLYVRSKPPLPALVGRTADAGALVTPPLGARVRRAVFGSAVDARVAGPRLIALTFDDGPYPVETPVLLALLHEARVRATFFVIGRDAEQYPGLTRAIAAGGHEIANHTQTHPNLDMLDAGAVTRELTSAAATLASIAPGPTETTLFRPPHGRFTLDTLHAIQAAGYDTVLWTDDPGDWRNVSAASLEAHVAARASSPEILLLHSGRPATVAMLPRLIERFRRAGYTFVTAGDLLRRVTPDQLNRAARTPLDP